MAFWSNSKMYDSASFFFFLRQHSLYSSITISRYSYTHYEMVIWKEQESKVFLIWLSSWSTIRKCFEATQQIHINKSLKQSRQYGLVVHVVQTVPSKSFVCLKLHKHKHTHTHKHISSFNSYCMCYNYKMLILIGVLVLQGTMATVHQRKSTYFVLLDKILNCHAVEPWILKNRTVAKERLVVRKKNVL